MQLSNFQVAVFGSSAFQNQSLAFYLQEKSGASCDCRPFDSLVDPGPGKDTDGHFHLTLLDCLGQEKNVILNGLKAYRTRSIAAPPLILLNLDFENGIERAALRYGVRGFLYRHENLGRLQKAIETVLSGEVWISRKKLTECLLSSRDASPDQPLPDLTGREMEILAFLTRGYSNQMIGDELCISPHTVKAHLAHIFKKINVHSRRQAARWSLDHLSR